MMLAVFLITFGPFGSWLSDGVDLLINQYLYSWIHAILVHFEVSAWLISLVTDGILTGVGGVLVFLPQIALLFLFLSFLEDSGYMSRAAFIMDRLLAPVWPFRKGLYPHADGIWLLGAGHHGCPDHGKRERPADDHYAHSLYELFCQASRLWSALFRFLRRKGWTCGIRAICNRSVHWYPVGNSI